MPLGAPTASYVMTSRTPPASLSADNANECQQDQSYSTAFQTHTLNHFVTRETIEGQLSEKAGQ